MATPPLLEPPPLDRRSTNAPSSALLSAATSFIIPDGRKKKSKRLRLDPSAPSQLEKSHSDSSSSWYQDDSPMVLSPTSPTASSAVVPTSSEPSVVPSTLAKAPASSAGFSFVANGASMKAGGDIGSRNVVGDGNIVTSTEITIRNTYVHEPSQPQKVYLSTVATNSFTAFPPSIVAERDSGLPSMASVVQPSSQSAPSMALATIKRFDNALITESRSRVVLPVIGAAAPMVKILFPKQWKRARRYTKRVGAALGFLSLLSMVASRD